MIFTFCSLECEKFMNVFSSREQSESTRSYLLARNEEIWLKERVKVKASGMSRRVETRSYMGVI